MASGIASVTLTGNLTKDPEAISDKLLTFSVAVNRREKDQQSGEWSDAPHYFDCKVIGNRASGLAGILEKGRGVTIHGDLVQERWEKDGQKRSAVRIIARDVVLHGSRSESGGQAAASDSEPSDGGLPF